MDMNNFWNEYWKRAGNDNTFEDKINQLKNLDFNEFIDPKRSDEFYDYLNMTLSSFCNFSRDKVLYAYKQGRKVGSTNLLTNDQKRIIKQEKYKAYVEVEPTDGNWDPEGFDDSFQGNSDMTLEEELVKLEEKEKDHSN